MEIAAIIRALQKSLEKETTIIGTGRKIRTQVSVEQICLTILAIRGQRGFEFSRSVEALLSLQNRDGSWPTFAGDESTGCWTTALATIALVVVGYERGCLSSAVHWLLDAKGREANWFWRWKFQTIDHSVQFDPTKYGWSWVRDTTSWVIPTAFSLLALRQIRNRCLKQTAGASERIDMGISMLLDRLCPDGGWNAGNGVAFGVAYAAYIDATAIALIALAGHENQPGVQTSLAWLVNRLLGCPSPYSLAWGILALAAFREISSEVNETVGRATKELTALIDKAIGSIDMSTLAICALALEAAEGDNVFEVRG